MEGLGLGAEGRFEACGWHRQGHGPRPWLRRVLTRGEGGPRQGRQWSRDERRRRQSAPRAGGTRQFYRARPPRPPVLCDRVLPVHAQAVDPHSERLARYHVYAPERAAEYRFAAPMADGVVVGMDSHGRACRGTRRATRAGVFGIGGYAVKTCGATQGRVARFASRSRGICHAQAGQEGFGRSAPTHRRVVASPTDQFLHAETRRTSRCVDQMFRRGRGLRILKRLPGVQHRGCAHALCVCMRDSSCWREAWVKSCDFRAARVVI